MSTLKPWAFGPFELLVHAETHYRNGEDFDRRIAIVSYDNAIEVAIHTYLNLHPVQRQNRKYARPDVEKWLSNYHTKVDFFMVEVTSRSLSVVCDKAEFVWYHEVRNGQYHVGGATVPQARELEGIRKAALWVFGVLYDVADVEDLLEQHLNPPETPVLPEKQDEDDRLIDEEFGIINVAGRSYYTSELVYALDPVLYSELANDIRSRDSALAEVDWGAQG
jgi:hypothetical protein